VTQTATDGEGQATSDGKHRCNCKQQTQQQQAMATDKARQTRRDSKHIKDNQEHQDGRQATNDG